jgi:hypothetical protein
MWPKIIALLIALFLLFVGGLCSIFLVFDKHYLTMVLGVVLAVVCIGVVIDVILWMTKVQHPASWIKILIGFLVVFVVYIISWSGLLDIRIAG